MAGRSEGARPRSRPRSPRSPGASVSGRERRAACRPRAPGSPTPTPRGRRGEGGGRSRRSVAAAGEADVLRVLAPQLAVGARAREGEPAGVRERAAADVADVALAGVAG